MSKIEEFLKTPRSIYFSIVLLLTLVAGLVSVSFSYYIDESTNSRGVELSKIDNRIHSNSLINNKIIVGAQNSITIPLEVMSNNNFSSQFKLYYQVESDNVEVYSTKRVSNTIGSYSILPYEIVIDNHEEVEVEVTFGIENGYLGNHINVLGKEIIEK